MSNSNLDRLTQTFNSPKVNLQIKSFKGKAHWEEVMKERSFSDIWSFIEWIAPVELFNVFNYQLIEHRFPTKTPTRERIIKLLRDADFYTTVVLNLHDPFKGYSITIHENLEAAMAYKPTRPTNVKMVKGIREFILQDYTDPYIPKTTALINTFMFYEEFSQFTALGNSNHGKRTFMIKNENGLITDKMDIGMNRIINWRGISFEMSTPVRDKSRSLYHVIGANVKASHGDASFFSVFRHIHHLINNYIRGANNDKTRISLSESYQPLVYNDSERLMRELRFRRIRLGILLSDFDQCFTPYIEIGDSTYEFIHGVVSR